jgi:hypothetical protein
MKGYIFSVIFKTNFSLMRHLFTKNKQSFILPCLVIIHLNPLFEKVNTMGVEFYLAPIKKQSFTTPLESTKPFF